MKKIFKNLLLIIGIFIFTNGFILTFSTNLNLGNILTLALGLILILVSTFFSYVKKLPKIIKIVFVAGLSFFIILSSFLICFGTNDTAKDQEDAIIVLGAGIRGEVPSRLLADRLNAAIKYHQSNPDAVIVVSGGQGPQESISEALAMERYLIKKGVEQNKIIREDRSTSTHENFIYSKAILDEFFDGDYSVAYVTNEYHIYRAGGIAKNAGFKATHIHSSTRWYSILPGTLRECLAVAKFWVFKD